jgi:general secretion pathway protein G
MTWCRCPSAVEWWLSDNGGDPCRPRPAALTAHAMRCRHPSATRSGGLTFLELVITMAIIFVLASIAMPLSRMNATRNNELELRQTLRVMRQTIDQFHTEWHRVGNQLIGPLCVENQITCKEVSSDFGYPVSLEVLLEVELSSEKAAVSGVDIRRYLRQIPTDPTTGMKEWRLRCYRDDPNASSWCGDDVYDVFSTSLDTALDGTPYREW